MPAAKPFAEIHIRLFENRRDVRLVNPEKLNAAKIQGCFPFILGEFEDFQRQEIIKDRRRQRELAEKETANAG